MTDVLTNLLDMMRVRSTAFVGKTLSAPWSIRIEEQQPFARFHLIVQGQTWIGLPGATDGVILKAGDFAIIPLGKAHDYRNPGNHAAGEPRLLPNFETGPYFESLPASGDQTHMLCGYFDISDRTPPTVLSRLPDLMLQRAGQGAEHRKFDLTVTLIREELANCTASSPIVLNRLTEALCVYAVHNWLQAAVSGDEHLRALTDPKTKLVLDHIHDDPARDWTVVHLARIFGQSRTAFAAHFKTATGLSPISYVRRWRMEMARDMLEDSQLTIDEIAFKAGYSDTNAFNRAFKRATGATPGTFKARGAGPAGQSRL